MTGHRPFAELRARMSPEARARSERRALELEAESLLHDLRDRIAPATEGPRGDDGALAEAGRYADELLGLVRHAVEAQGGRLSITAEFPDRSVRIEHLTDLLPGAAPRPEGAG